MTEILASHNQEQVQVWHRLVTGRLHRVETEKSRPWFHQHADTEAGGGVKRRKTESTARFCAHVWQQEALGFPLSFWMQLCVTVTVDTRCSPSPSSQLRREAEGGREACVRVCVCVSQPSAAFSSSPTVIPLSAICPSLKRQLFSKGPLGETETTGRLHVFFYPHRDAALLPVLPFF